MPPVSAWSRLRRTLGGERALLLFALLALVLAVLDPQPLAQYRRWLQVPTLAGLLGLLIAIQGIRDSGLVQHAAMLLVTRMHSLRRLGLLLVAVTALLAMLLTNDASLFLIVPLTVAIGTVSNLPVVRMVVLEALAVNAGSTLSPIGNPQNLLIWQHFHLSFLQFLLGMLPTAAIMLVLVALFTLCWLPRGAVASSVAPLDPAITSPRLGAWSFAGLATMVVAIDYGHAIWAAALLLGAFLVGGRKSLLRVDWPLLLLFALIFQGVGHFAQLPLTQDVLAKLDWNQPLVLFASGIIASQLVSNVPATVLLLNHATNALTLLAAVNVGGFGVAIGSLANLIALRLLRKPDGLGALHRASIPMLMLCAPLVYAVVYLRHA